MLPFFSHSSQGPRVSNQDSWLVTQIPQVGTLFCVADGVGGNTGGEIASKLAVQLFSDSMLKGELNMASALKYTHECILEKTKKSPELKGMASTLTAALITKDGVKGVSTGDSRAYALRGNGLKQLTTDHSEVAKLLSQGKISKEDALVYPRRNVLYSALGSHRPLEIDEFEFSTQKGDRFTLLSDGFYNPISKERFRDLSVTSATVDMFGNSLVNEISTVGTTDNYTILLFETV